MYEEPKNHLKSILGDYTIYSPILSAIARGHSPVNKKYIQIDVIGKDIQGTILGECKWTNSPINMSIVHSLIKKSELLKFNSQYYYYLFSKSGFTDDVIEYRNNHYNICLIDIKDMNKL